MEDSTLDYTIIRPGWFSYENEINYEVTYKGEAFKNPEARISRKSIADLVQRCIFENFRIRQVESNKLESNKLLDCFRINL
ncbi:NAD(P)H-binding protein [Helicobacter sp. 16-1353]|uniref:NAD(P)H-binding protein n=1 Tax=Helicobacter sp. 16-1353 TaxID=2004996 RepID=UPI00215C77B2|nr:NAD(P)H-binding protein [Helicobacter sp. 16-1353]